MYLLSLCIDVYYYIRHNTLLITTTKPPITNWRFRSQCRHLRFLQLANSSQRCIYMNKIINVKQLLISEYALLLTNTKPPITHHSSKFKVQSAKFKDQFHTRSTSQYHSRYRSSSRYRTWCTDGRRIPELARSSVVPNTSWRSSSLPWNTETASRHTASNRMQGPGAVLLSIVQHRRLSRIQSGFHLKSHHHYHHHHHHFIVTKARQNASQQMIRTRIGI